MQYQHLKRTCRIAADTPFLNKQHFIESCRLVYRSSDPYSCGSRAWFSPPLQDLPAEHYFYLCDGCKTEDVEHDLQRVQLGLVGLARMLAGREEYCSLRAMGNQALNVKVGKLKGQRKQGEGRKRKGRREEHLERKRRFVLCMLRKM